MKILIVSDIHANWPALRAVLESEPDADRILCLGDLVNYGPQPAECVRWAMETLTPDWLMQGNHDRAFARGIPPQCAPANRPVAEAVQAATNKLLTAGMRDFLGALQPLREFRCGDAVCIACHSHAPGEPGEPRDSHFGEEISRWSWESDVVLRGHPDKVFVLVGHPDLLFRAHTHAPALAHWGRTLAVNPGSVGRPTDGDPRAAYAVWEDGRAELRRVAYDVEQTIRAYNGLGLPAQIVHHLGEALRTGGGWPVEQTGRAETHA